MKSSILLSAVALLIANNSFAQIHNEQVQQNIHWAKNMADKLTRSKFDSTYVAAPEHKLSAQVFVGYRF